MIKNSHSSYRNPANLDKRFKDHRETSHFLRRRFVLLSLLNLSLIIASCAGILILVKKASTYPDILIKTKKSGVLYATTDGEKAVFDDESALVDYFEDILELGFKVNGSNLNEHLKAYISSGAHAELSRAFQNNDATFGQQIKLTEPMQFLPEYSSSSYIASKWKAEIFSRGIAGMQVSEIYLATAYKKGMPSKHNALGWKLHMVNELTAEQYYKKEIQQDIDEKTSTK